MEPLISVQEIEARLGGSGVTQAYVDGVSAAIRSYCGWHVAPSSSKRSSSTAPVVRC